MMVATSDRLAATAEDLEQLLREFLLKHTGLEEEPGPAPEYIIVIQTHYWVPLDESGRAIQAKLRAEYGRFSNLVAALLRGAPEDALTAAAEAEEPVRDIIDQSSTYFATVEGALEEAIGGIRTQVEQVNSLYDPTPGEPVFVPDTNAVVHNPDLEEWTFDDAPRFSIVLTSTLLGELDGLKMQHRVESVREKAEGAIRRIKEYRRRGDIRSGVTLRRDRSTVRMTAVEPDFEKTLPWLDATIEDDRLLAASSRSCASIRTRPSCSSLATSICRTKRTSPESRSWSLPTRRRGQPTSNRVAGATLGPMFASSTCIRQAAAASSTFGGDPEPRNAANPRNSDSARKRQARYVSAEPTGPPRE